MSTRKLRRPTAEAGNEPSGPGRVVFDSRGNPVWEWNTEAGDSTSVLLKQLENDDLALEPTRSFRSIDQRTAAPPKARPVPAGALAARTASAAARKSHGRTPPAPPHALPASARPTSAGPASAAPASTQSRPAPAHARHASAQNRRPTKGEPFELDEGKAGKGFDPYNRS